MQTHQLKRIHPNKSRMIVARGGKRGKTAGRGGKGQTARAGNKRRPEWRDIIKKLPKLRGRGVNQNKPVSEVQKVVNLMTLESVFNSGDVVTPTTLVEKRVVVTFSGKIPAIKILGEGEITKALKVSGCKISDSAKAKIEKAGGSVTLLTPITTQIIKVADESKAKAPKVEPKAEVKAEVKAEAKATKTVKEPKSEKAPAKAKTPKTEKPAK